MGAWTYLAAAFHVWMIIDAFRRRANFVWFIVIFVFGPIGSLVYFLAVKIHDFRRPKVEEGAESAAIPPETC